MIHTQRNLFVTTVSAAVLCLAACGPSASEKTHTPVSVKTVSAAEWLAKDSIGIFRGAEFGDESGTVRQMENDSFLVFHSPNLLKYEYTLPGKRRYILEYTFKKDRLSSFNFNIFLANESEAERLFDEFETLFVQRFGEEVTEMGVTVWPLPTGGLYKEAYLELRDESAEFGYGKLNLTAYAIR